MLVLDRVTRRFGRETAIEAVSLAVESKTTTAITGPNGSGKSTLLRLAAALDRPTAGVVRLEGRDLREDADARGWLGYAGHEVALYEALTGRENVAFRASLLRRKDPDADAEAVLDLFGVAPAARSMHAGSLSRGLRQRVSLARALVGEPKLVLLDEPHAGLDEAGVAALDAALDRLAAKGTTTVVATHDLGRLGARVDRVVQLERGHVVLDERRAVRA